MKMAQISVVALKAVLKAFWVNSECAQTTASQIGINTAILLYQQQLQTQHYTLFI